MIFFSGRGSVDRSSFSALNASGMVRNQSIVKQTLERLNLEAKSKGQSSPSANRRQSNQSNAPTPIVPISQPIKNAASTGGQDGSGSGSGNVINITPYGEGEDQSFTVNVNYNEPMSNPNFQNQGQFTPSQGQQFNNQGQYSTPLIENNAGLDNIVLGEPISLGGSGDPYGNMYGGANVNGPSTDGMFSPSTANAPQSQAAPIGVFDPSLPQGDGNVFDPSATPTPGGGNVFDPSAAPAPGGGNVFDPSVAPPAGAPGVDPLAEVGVLELELPEDLQSPFIGKPYIF